MFLRGIFGAAFGCPFPAFQSLFPSRGKAVTDEGENVEEPRAPSSASLRSAPSPLWGEGLEGGYALSPAPGRGYISCTPAGASPGPTRLRWTRQRGWAAARAAPAVFANISGESARWAAAPYVNRPASVGAHLCVRPETGGPEPHPVGRGLAPAATLCLVPVPRRGQAPALQNCVP